MPGTSPDRRNTVSHRWLRHPVNEVHAGQRREHLAVLQACSIAARPVAADPIVLVCRDTFNRALLGQIDPSLSHFRQRTACCRKLSCVNGTWQVDRYDIKSGGSTITPGDGVVNAAAPDPPITASKLSGTASHSDRIAKHIASGTYVGQFCTVPGTLPSWRMCTNLSQVGFLERYFPIPAPWEKVAADDVSRQGFPAQMASAPLEGAQIANPVKTAR